MRWSRDLAYAVGLLTTDGNLSKDGRHIELTSKDREQIETFIRVLKITGNKISVKGGSYNPTGKYYRIQFSKIKLYKFLLNIGLTPAKTKTVGQLIIPDRYFADFLRGHIDGDGYTSAFWDSIYKNSFRLYVGFISASKPHLQWIKSQIEQMYGIKGSIEDTKRGRIYQLKFAKYSSIILLKKIYYKHGLPCLERKRFKIEQALGIIQQHAGVVKLADTLA